MSLGVLKQVSWRKMSLISGVKMGFWNISVIVGLLILFLHQGSSDPSQLHCFRCITFACDNDPAICGSMKRFVMKEMELYYQVDESGLPECPDFKNELQWETLKNTAPSSYPCQAILNAQNGQATCTLGRFMVHSLVTETKANVTSHGTVMGCATKFLMDSIKNSGARQRVITTLNTRIGCHSDYAESPVKNSLKHFMELEHCTRVTDMCYVEDYCIHPRYSVVKEFQEPVYDPVISLKVIIWAFVIIGVLILVLTFAGIKYNA